MRKTIEDMVQQEVMCCMSSLVSTLAHGANGALLSEARVGRSTAGETDLIALCDQAFELASPVPDYEEAAIQAGWKQDSETGAIEHEEYANASDWEDACHLSEIEPYDWEVYEHWAVSTWFAEKLIEQGEKVDTDFGSLNVWARTTTGQAISMDGCIKRIYDAMMVPAEA